MRDKNSSGCLAVVSSQKVLEKDFVVYGTVENPLFLAKDVAEWIEYSKTSRGAFDIFNMLKSVDEDEKLIRTVFVSGQNREMWFLTEDGLYEVLMLSRKPIAKQFKKEVKKVLHQIRMTGGYSVPKSFAEALLLAGEQQKRIEEMQPKAEVYDRICNSDTLKSVDSVASNLGYGKKSFFALMRGMGIFYYSSNSADGEKVNLPKQEYKDRGYFVTKEEPYTRGDRNRLYTKIYVTGKGEVWLAKKLDSETDESIQPDFQQESV